MRITTKQLQVKLEYINNLLNLDPEKGKAFGLDAYSGKTRVIRYVNGIGGAESNVSLLGTKRETLTFIDGMITGLEVKL